MRFLKKKIQLKQEGDFDDKNDYQESQRDIFVKIETSISTKSESVAENLSNVEEFILPMRKPRQKPTCPDGNSKNIVKNYGKALCAFASSELAIPYLRNIVKKNGFLHVEIPSFMSFIKGKKDSVNSIDSLRKILIPNESDDNQIKAYKQMFKEASIIFLKYFSANWIFGGKLMHKKAHLKFRFKMLRRVRNPEQFTYLKTSAR